MIWKNMIGNSVEVSPIWERWSKGPSRCNFLIWMSGSTERKGSMAGL